MSRLRHRTTVSKALIVFATTVGIACTRETPTPDHQSDDPFGPPGIVTLLRDGQAVFGIFSGEHTPEQGALMGRNRETDFVFYSLEQGPFDISALKAFVQAMAETGGVNARPMALRIPPIRDGAEAAREHVEAGLDAGMTAIVFPHVESAEDAAVAVSSMGERGWPTDSTWYLANMLIVEDQEGIAHVDEIVATPGVSVVFAGPGDLRRAYDGDMDAVEAAIQAVLAACKAHDVACGITAGVDDIGARLSQGFRVIIVTAPEALAVGREAAGR